MPKPTLLPSPILISKTAVARKAASALLCAVLFTAALVTGIPRAYAADGQWWTLGTFLQPLGGDGDPDDAAKNAHPQAWTLYSKAREAAQAGEQEIAAVRCERAIGLYGARSPLAAKAYLLRAQALHALGRDHEAVRALNTMIELAPGRPEGYWTRAGIYMDASDHQKAALDYEAALRLAPELVGAYINRGVALAKLNRDGQALTAFEDAIKAADKRFSEVARFWQSSVYATATPGVSETMLALLRADHEATIAEAHVWRGRLHLVRSRYREAAQAYDKAVSVAPNYAPAYRYRGQLHEEMRHIRRARDDFRRAAELDPGQ